MWHGQQHGHYSDQHNQHSQPAATGGMPSGTGNSSSRQTKQPGGRNPNPNPTSSAAAAAGGFGYTSNNVSNASAAQQHKFVVKQEPVVPQRFLPKKGSSSSMKGNSNVSHSVAEKQRRDRINTLIDELRELVPIDLESAEANNQPYGEDPSKRPKHVVLSDTIKFVRNMLIRQQQQQQQQQQQIQQVATTARIPDEVLRIKKELADNGTT